MNSNGLDKLVWRACSTCNGQHEENTYYKISYKQQRMEEFEGEFVVKKFLLIRYLFMSNLEIPRRK
jgi:ribosomal protein S24E